MKIVKESIALLCLGMEIFTTILLVTFSLTLSIYLIVKGVRGMKKSIKELKEGNN
jgi:hypothetical protein